MQALCPQRWASVDLTDGKVTWTQALQCCHSLSDDLITDQHIKRGYTEQRRDSHPRGREFFISGIFRLIFLDHGLTVDN